MSLTVPDPETGKAVERLSRRVGNDPGDIATMIEQIQAAAGIYGPVVVGIDAEDRLSLRLRHHQCVGVVGWQGAEVDPGQDTVAVVNCKHRNGDAVGHHPPAHVELLEHLESSSVDHGSPRGCCALRGLINDQHLNAGAPECARESESGGTRTHDNDRCLIWNVHPSVPISCRRWVLA